MSKNYDLYPASERKIDNWRRRILGYEKMKRDLQRQIQILRNKSKKQKEAIDKAIKCIDYNTKYRNGADIYQFVDIESEILEPLKFILELDEENGNAYLKKFNDWLKEVE